MESNFIRERVHVREQIIKKNLQATNKAKEEPETKPAPKLSQDEITTIEELVNDQLKQDLVDLSKQVDSVCETIADYVKIRSALRVFQKSPRDVRLLTNIGCNFYAQCHIDDASKIYLCVGKDYYLHMELDEALKMVDTLEKQWMKRLDELQENASRIKAYIKIALEALGRVYDADKEKLNDNG